MHLVRETTDPHAAARRFSGLRDTSRRGGGLYSGERKGGYGRPSCDRSLDQQKKDCPKVWGDEAMAMAHFHNLHRSQHGSRIYPSFDGPNRRLPPIMLWPLAEGGGIAAGALLELARPASEHDLRRLGSWTTLPNPLPITEASKTFTPRSSPCWQACLLRHTLWLALARSYS